MYTIIIAIVILTINGDSCGGFDSYHNDIPHIQNTILIINLRDYNNQAHRRTLLPVYICWDASQESGLVES